ncbi:MAG: hypothetical protein E5V56_03430 [Mesorhizobium sp.]|nr:MAG: hypothetical protein E5V56_03430 [Mesorhizobium sp.]
MPNLIIQKDLGANKLAFQGCKKGAYKVTARGNGSYEQLFQLGVERWITPVQRIKLGGGLGNNRSTIDFPANIFLPDLPTGTALLPNLYFGLHVVADMISQSLDRHVENATKKFFKRLI